MVRIACCQIGPTIGDLAANAALIEAQIREAVEAGADAIVLPELATSGYMFADADEARVSALTTADFANWSAAAGNSIVIGGFCELGDDGDLAVTHDRSLTELVDLLADRRVGLY